jgi:serine protease Do
MFKKILGIVISCSLLLSACKPHEIRLAQRCLASTVVIHMKMTKGKKSGMGVCSGVYVAPNLILTADHCVDTSLEREKGITLKGIWIKDINDNIAKAEVVKTDSSRDLALLRTDLKGIPAKLARNVKVGEETWVVGNPLGLEFIVSKGIVSATDVTFEDFPRDHFITTATVLPGNSGGPAYNSKGQLIGIVVMSTSMLGSFGASGLGVVVQINEVRHFLKSK